MSWTRVDNAIESVRIAINANALRLLKQFKGNTFKFKPFSAKQKKVLNWWCPTSPVKGYNGIIADGSIRSGKTLSMSLSFVFWAMESFDGQNFALCGKTIGSLRRNVVLWLKLMLKSRGYIVQERRTDNLLIVRRGNAVNNFYLFGGRDERSQDLIQGITLAGILFDEVALMPESFVNQATARCSVDGSKWWFNCNPQGPQHWFYKKWIKRCRSLNLLYLHFTMDDNLSLAESIKERYRRQYSGVFFQRYIQGLWVLAEGLIYPNFRANGENAHVVPTVQRNYERYVVSNDYGVQHACVFGLWGLCDGIWYLVATSYHHGEKDGQRTVEDNYNALMNLIGDRQIHRIFLDNAPIASSFNVHVRRQWPFGGIRPADNEVLAGIQDVSTALNTRAMRFNDCNKEVIEEFPGYLWDTRSDIERPIKENDDCMDMVRYFVRSMLIANPVKKR